MTTTHTPVPGMTTPLPGTGSSWKAYGVCAQTDPELFFPEKGGSAKTPKLLCAGCPVLQECRDWALANDERFGVWGGLSERERRRIINKQRDKPARPVDAWTARRDRTIRRLTDEGYSAAEIAIRIGCTQRTVTRIRTAVAA